MTAKTTKTEDVDKFVRWIVSAASWPRSKRAGLKEVVIEACSGLVGGRGASENTYHFRAWFDKRLSGQGRVMDVAELSYNYTQPHNDRETAEQYVRNQLGYIERKVKEVSKLKTRTAGNKLVVESFFTTISRD